MWNIKVSGTVKIDGCPERGVEAVDFRRVVGLPEATTNEVALPEFEWTSEEDARTQPLDGSANFTLDTTYCRYYTEGERVRQYEYNRIAAAVAPGVLVAYLAEQTPTTAMAVIRAVQASKDKSREEAEATAAAYKTAKEQQEAAEKAAKETATAKKLLGEGILQKWVEEHGSELTKARLHGGYEWIGLAEVEFCNAVIDRMGLGGVEDVGEPDGYDDQPKAGIRTTPTLDEIRAFDAVKEKAGEGVSVELEWLTYDPLDDEDGYDYEPEPKDKLSRCEIHVTVTAPTGRECSYYYLPSGVLAATKKEEQSYGK